jgi:hypothetical protein
MKDVPEEIERQFDAVALSPVVRWLEQPMWWDCPRSGRSSKFTFARSAGVGNHEAAAGSLGSL